MPWCNGVLEDVKCFGLSQEDRWVQSRWRLRVKRQLEGKGAILHWSIGGVLISLSQAIEPVGGYTVYPPMGSM